MNNEQRATNWPPVTIVVWLSAAIILLALPLLVLKHGFLPPDDALRYAAKAISGKSWHDILMMRPDITIDHNPGWNSFMSLLYNVTGWDAHMLVYFCVFSMFILFAASPLPWLKRPESWLVSLSVILLISPYFALRAFVGRPLLLTMAITVVLLSWWIRLPQSLPSRTTLIVTTLLFALSTWVHGSWYLLPLIPGVFFLAREWRKSFFLSLCWLAGTILGALPTGEPIAWLRQTFMIPFLALGQKAPVNALVGEFQPFQEGYPALFVILVVVIWRKLSSRPLAPVARDPIFILAILGWALGFRVFRFWLDWGLPALTLWFAFQIDELLESKIRPNSWTRLALPGVAAGILFLGVTNNNEQQWSQYGEFEALDASRPEHAAWLPAPGGILYSVNLSVFYETFFTNPKGNWRYALGFEPSFMTPENYAVYLELWRSLNAIRATAPWVQSMTPADRLVLVSGPQTTPAIPQLEWKYAAKNTWVGRLRSTNEPPALQLRP